LFVAKAAVNLVLQILMPRRRGHSEN